MISKDKKINDKNIGIAVFASGNGSNLQEIIDFLNSNTINAEIKLVFSNNPDAYALRRAEKNNIKTFVLEKKDFSTREDFDAEILKLIDGEKIDLIILAGYMLLLSGVFINKYKNRIMNIHPALLPSFKGTHGIKDAFEYGVKVTGVTVHFVDEELDNGPIILQAPVYIGEKDDLRNIEEKIHEVEHKIYPKAIKYYCEDRLHITGRRVRII